jgi:hypothetical protein
MIVLCLVIEAHMFLTIAYFSSPYAHAATKGEVSIKSKNILKKVHV